MLLPRLVRIHYFSAHIKKLLCTLKNLVLYTKYLNGRENIIPKPEADCHYSPSFHFIQTRIRVVEVHTNLNKDKGELQNI